MPSKQKKWFVRCLETVVYEFEVEGVDEDDARLNAKDFSPKDGNIVDSMDFQIEDISEISK